MARRLFNGRAFSEDGWPYVDEGSCTWVTVPGTSVTLQIQNGPPLALLRAWAADWNAFIEPLRDADSACWTPGNSVATSNHPGGTAIDLNWKSHDFQVRGTLNAAQMAVMAEMEAFYEGNVFWAGRWKSPVDEMHSQCGYNTYDQDNDRPFPKVFDFIARKIRADGFSTFRRGNAPQAGDPALILSQATGLTLNRATEILPTMVDGLKQAECTNTNRIAMFIAQTGHESANFERTEEFASGAAYEGRANLGNTQPGDGVRFKGRTWIQITGRHNYGEFSEWSFDKGLVPTPTYFVDHPVELQDLKWAGTGAAWYWTVARGTRINEASDQRDLGTVTQLINGGQNGIDDRRTRYNRALALGDQLLALTTGGDDFLMALSADEQQRLLARTDQIWGALFNEVQSDSPYAKAGGDPIKTKDFIRFIDGATHALSVESGARLGHPTNIDQIASAAAAGNKRAQLALADLEANYPSVLQNYLALKGARQ